MWRKSVEETWKLFEEIGHDMPRQSDGTPYLPARMPNYDDPLPVNNTFYTTGWSGTDLSRLTMPRAYFGRSRFERVNFGGTDLSDSRMCWNDFTACDFSEADLRRCDMRASRFSMCIFRNADLSGADLRHSTFDACIFEGAAMNECVANKRTAREELIPLLTKLQRQQIRWLHENGPLPPGG